MDWAQSQYDTEVIDAAGIDLARGKNVERATAIIGNWRSAHAFPLNTFRVGLRRMGSRVDETCIIAQRLKRLSSIAQKVQRYDWLKLSDMQDVAGCRAVVRDVTVVEELVETYQRSRIRHSLIDEDDYIGRPKRSGYRSHHLVYRYFSERSHVYNGMKVEVQIRSHLQHAWATAVETVGTFTGQALKSSLGWDDWLRFFSLMGSAIARREGTKRVPGTPSNARDLREELRQLERTLRVQKRLRMFQKGIAVPEASGSPGTAFYLLELDARTSTIRVDKFGKQDGESASRAYTKRETETAEDQFIDVVLVSLDSIRDLRRAFPNYFLDASAFIAAVGLATN